MLFWGLWSLVFVLKDSRPSNKSTFEMLEIPSSGFGMVDADCYHESNPCTSAEMTKVITSFLLFLAKNPNMGSAPFGGLWLFLSTN